MIVLPSHYNEEIKAILDVISKESVKSVGLKLVLKSLFNCFETLLIEKGIEEMSLANISLVA